MTTSEHPERLSDIAVIGMAGRFPGARNVEELWENLCNGVESITSFSERELAAAGVPRKLRASPDYVGARGIIEGFAEFDAALGQPPPNRKQKQVGR